MIPWIVSRRKKTQSSKIDDDVQNKSDFIFEIISNVLIEKFLDLLAKVKQNNTQWFHKWHIFSARNSCGTWERDRTKNMTWNRQSFHTDIQDRHFSIYKKTLFNDILRYLCGFFFLLLYCSKAWDNKSVELRGVVGGTFYLCKLIQLRICRCIVITRRHMLTDRCWLDAVFKVIVVHLLEYMWTVCEWSLFFFKTENVSTGSNDDVNIT